MNDITLMVKELGNEMASNGEQIEGVRLKIESVGDEIIEEIASIRIAAEDKDSEEDDSSK